MFLNIFIFIMIGITDITSTIYYSDMSKELLSKTDFPPRGYVNIIIV